MSFGKRIAHAVRRRVLFPLGWNFALDTEDRRVLERVIFPYLVKESQYRRVLFVGCEIYTHGYNRTFQNKDYWTIEIRPENRRYGAKQHVTAGLQEVHLHCRQDFFDVVICNGVFGWGIDDAAQARAALAAAASVMRPGGLLVLGWNETPQRTPFPMLDDLLKVDFEPVYLPPLGTAVLRTETAHRHVYSFFVKSQGKMERG